MHRGTEKMRKPNNGVITNVLEIDGGILRIVERSIHVSDIEGLSALVGDTDEDLVDLTDGQAWAQRRQWQPPTQEAKIKDRINLRGRAEPRLAI